MISPYLNKDPAKWGKITEMLISKHPLSVNEIRDVVLESWEEIFRSKIGKKAFRIGKDIFPKPQIMGFLLHELIPLEFSARYPNVWSKEKIAHDKDLVYIPNDTFSIEIKTSSNPNSIFGNRSYAQEVVNGKKDKSGYYLAVNFEKCADEGCPKPKILKIRFGWLDHTDWMGQTAASGQQARLSSAVEKFKLFEIYLAK